jgi:hypothetical protein
MTKNSNKDKNNGKFYEISLFKNPFETIYTLFVIISEQFVRLIRFLIGNKILIILSIGYTALNFMEGPHKEVLINF